MCASLHIVRSANPVSPQDAGRWGFQHLGVGSAGAADKYAQRWANKLLNNSISASTLELFLGQTKFKFSHSTRASITGADCKATLNGQALTNWTAFDISAGDELQLSVPQHGIYSYLGIRDGFNIPRVLGSSSLNSRESLGPNSGRAFGKNDVIEYSEVRSQQFKQTLHWLLTPNYNATPNIRIIPSELSRKTQIAWPNIESSDFRVHTDSNKMGIRLSGETLPLKANNDAYSEGLVEGCIQVPPDGQPIVLMANHQTIGGYPLLGCVYAVDLPLLAQRRPGQNLRFIQGNIEEAQKLFHKELNLFS